MNLHPHFLAQYQAIADEAIAFRSRLYACESAAWDEVEVRFGELALQLRTVAGLHAEVTGLEVTPAQGLPTAKLRAEKKAKRAPKKSPSKPRGKTTRYSDQFKAEVLAEIDAGESALAVAKRRGLAASNVYKWAKQRKDAKASRKDLIAKHGQKPLTD